MMVSLELGRLEIRSCRSRLRALMRNQRCLGESKRAFLSGYRLESNSWRLFLPFLILPTLGVGAKGDFPLWFPAFSADGRMSLGGNTAGRRFGDGVAEREPSIVKMAPRLFDGVAEREASIVRMAPRLFDGVSEREASIVRMAPRLFDEVWLDRTWLTWRIEPRKIVVFCLVSVPFKFRVRVSVGFRVGCRDSGLGLG